MISIPDPGKRDEAILCVVGWWPEGTHVGGIFIREHVEAVAEHYKMIVVHGIVSKGSSLWPSIQVLSTEENGVIVHRIKIHTWLRRFGLSNYLIRRTYGKVVHKMERAYNLRLMHIHVRTDESEQALFLTKKSGLDVVISEHNSFYNLGMNKFSARKWDLERKRIRAWFGHSSIQKVMPVSQHLGNTLYKNFGVPREKIKVIPNIAAADFVPGPPPASDRFQIMLAAYWRPPKDHDVFIEAMKLIPSELAKRCSVVWGGSGPHMEQIRERCANELKDFDIRFPGYLDKAAMAEWMQSSHVFVLPTKSENLPCVILESLSCGTPVISMDLNGIPEMVNEHNGILVPASDPHRLADAIMTMFSAHKRYDRNAIAADAFSRYSVEVIASQILEVYDEVIRKPHGE